MYARARSRARGVWHQLKHVVQQFPQSLVAYRFTAHRGVWSSPIQLQTPRATPETRGCWRITAVYGEAEFSENPIKTLACHQQKRHREGWRRCVWCDWRGSNPRPLASEANTLSTELQSHFAENYKTAILAQEQIGLPPRYSRETRHRTASGPVEPLSQPAPTILSTRHWPAAP